MQRRSEGSDNLLYFDNQTLGRVERTNRANKSKQVTMGDRVDNPPVTRADFERLQEQLQQLQQVQPGMGDADAPHTFFQNRSAICPPALERNDYHLHPQMIGLVKNYTFHGLPAENPMDHIENFEEICSTTRANGVPEDWIKCKLFSFSLADKASRWLKSLPPASLTTWDQCRDAFLDNFYTKSKTTSLRNKIVSFQQFSGESFGEAFERFKEEERRREVGMSGGAEIAEVKARIEDELLD